MSLLIGQFLTNGMHASSILVVNLAARTNKNLEKIVNSISLAV
jgi:hypothetical protein